MGEPSRQASRRRSVAGIVNSRIETVVRGAGIRQPAPATADRSTSACGDCRRDGFGGRNVDSTRGHRLRQSDEHHPVGLRESLGNRSSHEISERQGGKVDCLRCERGDGGVNGAPCTASVGEVRIDRRYPDQIDAKDIQKMVYPLCDRVDIREPPSYRVQRDCERRFDPSASA